MDASLTSAKHQEITNDEVQNVKQRARESLKFWKSEEEKREASIKCGISSVASSANKLVVTKSKKNNTSSTASSTAVSSSSSHTTSQASTSTSIANGNVVETQAKISNTTSSSSSSSSSASYLALNSGTARRCLTGEAAPNPMESSEAGSASGASQYERHPHHLYHHQHHQQRNHHHRHHYQHQSQKTQKSCRVKETINVFESKAHQQANESNIASSNRDLSTSVSVSSTSSSTSSTSSSLSSYSTPPQQHNESYTKSNAFNSESKQEKPFLKRIDDSNIDSRSDFLSLFKIKMLHF